MSDTTPKSWTPFWWESNACFGAVLSPEDWEAMVDNFAKDRRIDPRAAREEMIRIGATATWDHPNTTVEMLFQAEPLVSIGMRREHIGGQPFKAWLEEHGMYDAAMGPPPRCSLLTVSSGGAAP